jgi:hypothetical protein
MKDYKVISSEQLNCYLNPERLSLNVIIIAENCDSTPDVEINDLTLDQLPYVISLLSDTAKKNSVINMIVKDSRSSRFIDSHEFAEVTNSGMIKLRPLEEYDSCKLTQCSGYELISQEQETEVLNSIQSIIDVLQN